MKVKHIRGGLSIILNLAVLKHSMESNHVKIDKVDIYLLLQVQCNLHDFTFTLKIDFSTIFIDLSPLLNHRLLISELL